MTKTVAGMLCSFGAAAITLTDVEQNVRVAAAIVGLIIGCVTLVNCIFTLVRNIRGRQRDKWAG